MAPQTSSTQTEPGLHHCKRQRPYGRMRHVCHRDKDDGLATEEPPPTETQTPEAMASSTGMENQYIKRTQQSERNKPSSDKRNTLLRPVRSASRPYSKDLTLTTSPTRVWVPLSPEQEGDPALNRLNLAPVVADDCTGTCHSDFSGIACSRPAALTYAERSRTKRSSATQKTAHQSCLGASAWSS
jgi:hypothetical protein